MFVFMLKAGKLYFASDFHLGVPSYESSLEREKRVINWLDYIKHDAAEVFLMGDVFDFWFEYKHVVPKGYIRFLSKLAELVSMGIQVTLFKGNHDMWMFGYLEKEIGVKIVSDELILDRDGKRFYLHHGDGLGTGDRKYKILKKVFRSNLSQWAFSWLHPNIGMAIAEMWSKNSRIANNKKEEFKDENEEWLVGFSKNKLEKEYFDYFIYGHRHLPLSINLGKGSLYINLGEWMNYNSYAVFDGKELELKYWESPSQVF
jgi:UDP-2,3-diacylglucosamine hydrolase